ncbi:MAG: hemolysin family protein [Chloroflexota bacterium]
MEPGSWGNLLLLALFILLNAFFAATETALSHLSRSRLRQLAGEGIRWAGLAERLADESLPLLTTVYLGTILAQFAAAALAVVLLGPPLSEWIAGFASLASLADFLSILFIVLILALITVMLGQLLPMSLALRDPEGVALRLVPIFAVIYALLSPVVRGLTRLAPLARTLSGGEHPGVGVPLVTEERIKEWVDAGEEGGVIEEDEKEMIFSIFEFGDTLAREIMVPRIDVTALDVMSPLDAAVELVLQKGFSRIPVYRDTIDNVLGLLYAKDLLRHLKEGAGQDGLESLLRPAYFVPESKELDELLQELQKNKIHMAIVVDEYGGMAGVVTIEDIIEEIVGEIQDEYDSEEPFAQLVSDTEAVLNARIDLDDLNKLLGVSLPTDEADTLGGLIYNCLGKVPAVGDTVRIGDLCLEVMSVLGRRIKVVRIVRLAPDLPQTNGDVQIESPEGDAL